MATKFKDVAHLYLGCEIKTEEGVGTLNEVSTEKSDEAFITSYDLVSAYPKYDEFKPILRPLSDMSVTERDTAYAQYEIERTMIEAGAARTAYLLSLGFDLFGLIENGEAIDKTKLT